MLVVVGSSAAVAAAAAAAVVAVAMSQRLDATDKPVALLAMGTRTLLRLFALPTTAVNTVVLDSSTCDNKAFTPAPRVGTTASTSPRTLDGFILLITQTQTPIHTNTNTRSELMGETSPLPGGRQPAELVRASTMKLKLAERARLLALAEEAERSADEEAAKVAAIEVELQERLELAAATQKALAEVMVYPKQKKKVAWCELLRQAVS